MLCPLALTGLTQTLPILMIFILFSRHLSTFSTSHLSVGPRCLLHDKRTRSLHTHSIFPFMSTRLLSSPLSLSLIHSPTFLPSLPSRLSLHATAFFISFLVYPSSSSSSSSIGDSLQGFFPPLYQSCPSSCPFASSHFSSRFTYVPYTPSSFILLPCRLLFLPSL